MLQGCGGSGESTAAAPLTPAVDAAVISGMVQDAGTAAPLAGARITAVPIADAGKVSPASLASTTAAADGTFTLPSIPLAKLKQAQINGAAYNVALFIAPPAGQPYPTLHQGTLVSNGNNPIAKPLALTRLADDEAAWLQLLENDRAAKGAPAVVMDEFALRVARSDAATLFAASVCGHGFLYSEDEYFGLGGLSSNRWIEPVELQSCGDVSSYLGADAFFGASLTNADVLWVGLGEALHGAVGAGPNPYLFAEVVHAF